MGIPGLTTFINMNPTLFQPYKLHGTQVVIDGYNLLHVLYYEYHINHRYCGNYDQFAKNIEHYFSAFSICDVKPVIVFDGGYEKDDRKLRTTLRRAQERIHLAGFISHGGSGKILPVLAEVTFKNVLAKLNISHMTCNFEADDELAALANHWGCPVISNDSDFFVFNVHGGFIPLDHLTVQVSKNSDGTKYLDTHIYRIETFVKHFKCRDVQFVPLLATLLGNDFVDGRKFENFFSNIKLPRVKSKRFTVPAKNTKMAGLLIWLEDMDSVEEAVETILQYFKKDDRDYFEKIILRSIDSYTKIVSKLQHFFEDRKAAISECDSDVKSYNGIDLPVWFLREFRLGNLSSSLFNVLVLHRVIPLCQVENMEVVNAHQCAYEIRRIIYGILLKKEQAQDNLPVEIPTETDSLAKATRATHVEEYTRIGKKLTKHCIEPCYVLPGGNSVPLLQNIPDLSNEIRTSVLFDAFGLKVCDFEEIPDELRLVLACTVVWLRSSNPKVTKEHLQGLLVSVLKLLVIEPALQEVSGNLDTELELSSDMYDLRGKIFDACSIEEIKAAKIRIDKTVRLPHHDSMCAEVVHGFAQWHACLLSAVHLNQLLLRPVPQPDPARIYNGTVAYAFCKELTLRKDPCLYVSEVLGRRTKLTEIYNNWMQFCLNLVDEDVFYSTVSTRKKGSKKGKKKDSKGKVNVVAGTSGSPSGGGDARIKKKASKGVQNQVHKSCNLSNKFSMLALSDDSASEGEIPDHI
ncbi:protein asteroid homolog 1-like [Lineus longissimus]|uniref:protein asteroid homolog 1-like n=1 Tax=Lineus longissimus TaxID=88925 RepID=UPI00315C82E6